MAQKTKFTPALERSAYASVADLAAHFSVSVDSIWRWTRNGDFPAPVKLSPQMTRWRWSDVQAWEQSRTAARNETAAQAWGGGVFDMRLKTPREYRARPLAASHEANPMIQHQGFYSGPTQIACRPYPRGGPQMTDACTLALTLGGRWYGRYGVAPCPVCQPERRKDQTALTPADGAAGLLLSCKKSCYAFRDILAAAGVMPGEYAPPDPAVLARREAARRREAEKRERQARAIWAEALPITGTPAETYLRGRASYDALAGWLFHMATSQPLEPGKLDEGKAYVGEANGTHVWLIYRPDLDWLKSPDAALTLSFARQVAGTQPDARHFVFAPARYVSQRMLDAEGLPVEFVPLPHSLYRMERD